MKQELTNQIKDDLTNENYDWAVAVATEAEINAKAACGQLSIITETEETE